MFITEFIPVSGNPRADTFEAILDPKMTFYENSKLFTVRLMRKAVLWYEAKRVETYVRELVTL
jgi:hypothetical protein